MNREDKKNARNRLWTRLKEKYPEEHMSIKDAEPYIGLNLRRISDQYDTFYYFRKLHIRIDEVVDAVSERQGLI